MSEESKHIPGISIFHTHQGGEQAKTEAVSGFLTYHLLRMKTRSAVPPVVAIESAISSHQLREIYGGHMRFVAMNLSGQHAWHELSQTIIDDPKLQYAVSMPDRSDPDITDELDALAPALQATGTFLRAYWVMDNTRESVSGLIRYRNCLAKSGFEYELVILRDDDLRNENTRAYHNWFASDTRKQFVKDGALEHGIFGLINEIELSKPPMFLYNDLPLKHRSRLRGWILCMQHLFARLDGTEEISETDLDKAIGKVTSTEELIKLASQRAYERHIRDQ